MQCILLADSTGTVHDGHLKPFGSVGSFVPTDEINGFPNTMDFFRQYVNPTRPLKMVGAGKLSKSFVMWTDDYFLSLDQAGDYSVSIESGKKENRSNPMVDMSFWEFVKTYNSTNHYMVDTVPDFIRKDVLLPGPLQCHDICEEMLVENILWMSSGGTSSVVHTDSVDNIICSYRGEKQFILVDPKIHRDHVDIDHPEGAFSDIDVDRVDYIRYPGMAAVSYHVINISSGDCLYIPFKWIHQVRSFGSNVAVNIWWSHQKSERLDVDRCTNDLDTELTLDKVTFYGFAPITDDMEMLKDHFTDFIRKETDLDQFLALFTGESHVTDTSHILPLKQIFLLIDKNRDRKISPEELTRLSEKEWKMVQRQMDRFEVMMEESNEDDTKGIHSDEL